ncbi:hypothetical protein KAFR_0C03000 [Kazachstania africana CBS 2517]|uniref:Arf-GAP domain-containing protein n=1 Tax=Kazachstania africana (strain ATCC 22294 / BCRC 22015 / CBS 2517 / CECT 1963 / NBRC 1671 / NRRL Y-8276) TaxID=1071382 RepID=H2ASE3_KAZAF|nr:hypothetical protein KAFR_0C03000 [Kazachstania africana CBS 2517]CCF57293.1 hypothetical protein KAFR_0C03000 [Kazachstania africana CBS 2517]
MRFRSSSSRSAYDDTFNSRPRNRTDQSVVNELKDYVTSSDNGNKCAECSSTFPTWCSVNLGCFLCGRCASVHRKILNHEFYVSDVKSLSIDTWHYKEIDHLKKLGGNKGNKKFWNPRNEPFPYDAEDDKSIAEQFVRNKYILGKYKYDEVKPEDFEGLKSRSRANSCGHRRSGRYDDQEVSDDDRYESDYRRQVRQLKEMGFSDSEKNLKALKKSNGNMNRAIDVLGKEENRQSVKETVPNPSLPARPSTSAGPQPAIFDGMSDMASLQQQQPVMTGAVQQYLDPATGIIYVDQNQYIMAQALQQNQQQAQMMQMQQAALQQQQQAIQQQYQQQVALQQQQVHNQQKNAILGLYQRPDLYTTPVEITESNPQYKQLFQQQQQQQQQFQNQFQNPNTR